MVRSNVGFVRPMGVIRKLVGAVLVVAGAYLMLSILWVGGLAIWIWTGAPALEPNWPWIAYGMGQFLLGAGATILGLMAWTGRAPRPLHRPSLRRPKA